MPAHHGPSSSAHAPAAPIVIGRMEESASTAQVVGSVRQIASHDKHSEFRHINCFGPWLTMIVISALVLVCHHAVLSKASDAGSAAMKVAIVCFGGLASACCFCCHFVDPGFPIRDCDDQPPADPGCEDSRTRRRVERDGTEWLQKWCRDCRLWRPRRCGHCSMCRRCVLRLDHHCFWMGTCVGERNQRFFTAFLLFAGCGMMGILILALHRLTELNAWLDVRAFTATFEPLLIIFFVCCCPPVVSVCYGGPGLLVAGANYCCMMLFDLETDKMTDCQKFTGEFRSKSDCPGVRIYMMSPVQPRRSSQPYEHV